MADDDDDDAADDNTLADDDVEIDGLNDGGWRGRAVNDRPVGALIVVAVVGARFE